MIRADDIYPLHWYEWTFYRKVRKRHWFGWLDWIEKYEKYLVEDFEFIGEYKTPFEKRYL